MSFEPDVLWKILGDMGAKQYRKGPAQTVRQVGSVQVVDLYFMEPVVAAPDGLTRVDVHFFVVGVNLEQARQHRQRLVNWLTTYPEPERLAGGPSYIEVGGVIGDQGTALVLFGVGEVLGLWKVITPGRVGITGPEADELAGGGLVMISGWRG